MPLELIHRRSALVALAALCLLASVGSDRCRGDDPPSVLDIFDAPDIGGNLLSEPDPQVSASLLSAGGDLVTLSVRLELPEGGNTYSQDPSFAKPTQFAISEEIGLTPVDPGFTPSTPPKRGFDESLRREVEKHYGTVTWTRSYRLTDGFALSRASVAGKISFLYCKGECSAKTLPFTATVAAASPAPDEEIIRTGAQDLAPPPVEDIRVPSLSAAPKPAPAGGLAAGYQVVPQYAARLHRDGDPAKVQFVFDQQAAPGLAIVAVTLELAPDYHVYALTKAPGQQLDPTSLEVKQIVGLKPVSVGFEPTTAPELHEADVGTEVLQSLNHDGSVTWTRVYEVEAGASPGVEGSLRFQICKGEEFCLQPVTIPFSLGSLQDSADTQNATVIAGTLSSSVRQTALAAAGHALPEPNAASGPSTAAAPSALTAVAYENADAANSLWQWLAYAFFGGLILNVMPCVLPVISIKVLSFVHQAGEHPWRILMLNVVYSLGVLTVFFALATLALTLQLGWGAQNQSAAYNMVMVAVVFAMGLSLLGVFEIPIPGMMSSGIGGSHGEGLMGAYLTGILATLLATPCTGPYMATVLFWSLQQPAYIVFLIWGVMGLGMASPYLMIGCVPSLVDWLPRPGQWMVTFKQVCGFVLMGTVVWMLNTIQGINPELVIPTLLILVGVAVAVWMVGQLYDLSSSQSRRWLIRGLSVLVAGPIIALGVHWSRAAVELAAVRPTSDLGAVNHAENELPWEPFSNSRLDELVRTKTPILIDFTADWCGICKANEFRALNTQPTLAFVREHGFVTLKADYTRESPEIREWLNKFDQDSVPLYLFIPGGQPKKTKVLRESISQSQVLETLNETLQHSANKPANASTAAGSGDSSVSLN